MRLLLDTHTFLWMRTEPEKLPDRVVSALLTYDNSFYLSFVSLWEMTIKSSKGSLRLPSVDIGGVIAEMERYPTQILPLELADLSALESLPQIHKDPFDRLLIAQALRLDLTIISRDSIFPKHNVPILWD